MQELMIVLSAKLENMGQIQTLAAAMKIAKICKSSLNVKYSQRNRLYSNFNAVF